MKKIIKKIAFILSIASLAVYVFSLVFVAVKAVGWWGLLVVPFFWLATLYQIVTHLIVGDVGELVLIVAWLGCTYGLYVYSRSDKYK